MKLLIITQKVDSKDQLLGFFIEWLEKFAEKFEHLTVLCLEKGSFDLPGNVEILSLGKDSGQPKICWLLNFYRLISGLRGRYDAVFVHMNPIWVFLGGFWWHRMSKKVFFWYTHKAVTFKLKLAEKFADVIFTASKESFRLPSGKVIVTGHGINTDLFRPSQDRKINDKITRLLSVGRIAPVKNYEVLIKAAEILKDQGFNFSVSIIGEPALKKDELYEKRLREKIKSSELEGRFNFLGKVINRDLAPYYQSHDVFVHLSKTGSVDKVLLEAMACGMGVVSCNDSARSFLSPDLIFEENDSQGLAERIMMAAAKGADADLRKYVLENHNLDDLINKITRVISE
jgi:glycosyltransferase involved in cell wall biosynthesis